jgi:hypothetical protein
MPPLVAVCSGWSGGWALVSPGERLASRRVVGPSVGRARPELRGSRASPRGAGEGRREPSFGNPMKNRRTRKGARAGWSTGSSRRSGWEGEARPGARNQKTNTSRVIGWGRLRRRHPLRAGTVPRKHHPQARGAGAVTSQDQYRTVKRRRWISLRSGRSAIPHLCRTQPELDSIRSGGATRRMPSGGTWT